MSSPTFLRLAEYLRQSSLPEDLRQKMLLVFHKMTDEELAVILATLSKNADTLPILAEFLTELEQNQVNLADTSAAKALLAKYIAKFPL